MTKVLLISLEGSGNELKDFLDENEELIKRDMILDIPENTKNDDIITSASFDNLLDKYNEGELTDDDREKFKQYLRRKVDNFYLCHYQEIRDLYMKLNDQLPFYKRYLDSLAKIILGEDETPEEWKKLMEELQ